MDGAGGLSTDALQGRACKPQVPGCVVLWRSPLHTIYFQIHLQAPAESVQITLVMSGQESRGYVGEYQADEKAGVARLSWLVSGK